VLRVVGTVGQALPLDQWVTVTGNFHRGGNLPELAATSVVEIREPNDTYE
jgi:uncharacterized membrane protein YcgQ (UPF0703/DUF1980 family)